MATKEGVVSALANPRRLAKLLIELEFFKEFSVSLTCPNRKEYYLKEFRCEVKKEPDRYTLGSCSFNWSAIGKNPECPFDRELEVAFDEAGQVSFEEVLARNIEFSLMQPIKSGNYEIGVADAVVEIPNSLPINKYFQLTFSGPKSFFILVDLELKNRLKALHQTKRLWNEMPKATPILITMAGGPMELFESQKIRVYRWGEHSLPQPSEAEA